MTTRWIASLLTREIAAFSRELDLFPEPELIWATVPGISNSAGTLALHVSGNLQHYIGAILGNSGYVRDRDLEFSARGLPRVHLSTQLTDATHIINEVLPTLTEQTLSMEYPDVLGGPKLTTGVFLLHLATHAAFHLGQAGYLRRVLTGDTTSSGAISMKALPATTSSAA